MKQTWFSTLSLLLLVTSSSLASAGAAQNQDKLTAANTAYGAGDCQKALEGFNSLQGEPGLDEATRLQILFRKSYCQMNLGSNVDAAKGFAAYLAKDPNNEEARVRLAQSELQAGRYAAAHAHALKLPASSSFSVESKIYVARASMELGATDRALQELNSITNPGDWKAVVTYWKGVVQYRRGESQLALAEFHQASSEALPNSWVPGDAKGWIDRIQAESRWFSGYVSLGYISDSNIAQSSTNNLVGGAGSGNEAANQGPPLVGDSTAIKDTGYWLGVGLNINPYTSYSKNFTYSVSYSSPYYSSSNSGYDYRVWATDLSSNFRTASGNWWGGKVQYSKTFYDTTESESYLVFDPYYNWNISSDWSVKFGLTYNKYMKTTGSSTTAPALSTYYGISNNFGLKGGLSYLIGSGNQANYVSGNPPVISSGSMFSNYSTYSGYVGYWWELMDSLDFSGQAALYSTSYKHETAPVPNGQAAPDDRSDQLTQYILDLSYTVIPKRWTFDLSATFSKNKSSGFQGLPAYGSLTTYSYSRDYYLLTTTVSY